ncbi:hypothetical protein BEN74_04770 [Acinetobacter sp. WCHAc010034]|uniref:hypothetical protein n=1 Tax=Acinetobacter sp. WCHAc010034 TaxID=1879049 RepID=UPI000A3B107F|nr:hypothetical protein [Acinetobacter sp. WCHAc010034]AYA02252.1 hypothetical protein BEN74_04770 [Acinetobacter sp. WCHAc010034]
MSNLAQIPSQPAGEVVQFPKNERKAMSDQLSKGFIMKSRLYHFEVEPFLSDAAKNVYSVIMGYTNGFNKSSDHISHRQIQGGKLKGSNKLSSGTVTSGIKELVWFGVIAVVEKNNKLGNKYQINEVSLAEYFEQFDASVIKALRISNRSASITDALRLVVQSASISGAECASTSGASIEFLFIDSFRYLNNTLRDKNPLQVNFFEYQEIKKQDLLDQQKLEAEQKAKSAAERKEKTRKLSFDEVIDLTRTNIQKLCTPDLWEQFVTNRSEYKKTALTKNALKTIHDDFKAWGIEKSDISLKTAIKGNHQGLFEPRISAGGNFGNQTQSSTRMAEIQELIAQEEQGNATYGF